MTDKKQALTDLLAKVEAGGKYETMGHTIMCQKAFPKPSDFDGSREAYAKSAAQQAILAWRNGSLDAAKALDMALPTKAIMDAETMAIVLFSKDGARHWLAWKIKALIAEETQ